MTPKEVIEFAKKNGARMVDLKFLDLPGIWQHFTVPIEQLSEESFEEGFGWSLSCSLFSPMLEFEDQAAALETAGAALAEVLDAAAELDAPEQEMQDIWEGKYPEPAAGEEAPPAPPKDMDRRTFLRGTVPEDHP